MLPYVLVCALWSSAVCRLGWVMGLVTLVLVVLTTESGELLEGRVRESALVEEHAEMGSGLTPWAIALFVLTVAVWLLGCAGFSRKRDRSGEADSRAEGGASAAARLASPVVVRVVALVTALVVAARPACVRGLSRPDCRAARGPVSGCGQGGQRSWLSAFWKAAGCLASSAAVLRQWRAAALSPTAVARLANPGYTVSAGASLVPYPASRKSPGYLYRPPLIREQCERSLALRAVGADGADLRHVGVGTVGPAAEAARMGSREP
ncbi:hypothetical protein [Streptomyces griseofuscus]|uniref:hypothetical protein n=1 Tax=Streptomyces griseofuscus TaxID=146922 RepID=UPI00155B029F|nr:hypothetical protein [Streptomyces griseofuscus]